MPVPQKKLNVMVERASSPFLRMLQQMLWWNGLLSRHEQARCLFHKKNSMLWWNGLLARS